MENPYSPEQKYEVSCGITAYGIWVFVCMCAPWLVCTGCASSHRGHQLATAPCFLAEQTHHPIQRSCVHKRPSPTPAPITSSNNTALHKTKIRLLLTSPVLPLPFGPHQESWVVLWWLPSAEQLHLTGSGKQVTVSSPAVKQDNSHYRAQVYTGLWLFVPVAQHRSPQGCSCCIKHFPPKAFSEATGLVLLISTAAFSNQFLIGT